MPKRTYRPDKKVKAKRHGFRRRSRTRAGKRVLKRRIIKGRKLITP